jgi:hypothetical protein
MQSFPSIQPRVTITSKPSRRVRWTNPPATFLATSVAVTSPSSHRRRNGPRAQEPLSSGSDQSCFRSAAAPPTNHLLIRHDLQARQVIPCASHRPSSWLMPYSWRPVRRPLTQRGRTPRSPRAQHQRRPPTAAVVSRPVTPSTSTWWHHSSSRRSAPTPSRSRERTARSTWPTSSRCSTPGRDPRRSRRSTRSPTGQRARQSRPLDSRKPWSGPS